MSNMQVTIVLEVREGMPAHEVEGFAQQVISQLSDPDRVRPGEASEWKRPGTGESAAVLVTAESLTPLPTKLLTQLAEDLRALSKISPTSGQIIEWHPSRWPAARELITAMLEPLPTEGGAQ